MAHPFPLFESIWTPSREIAVTPDVTLGGTDWCVTLAVTLGGRGLCAVTPGVTPHVTLARRRVTPLVTLCGRGCSAGVTPARRGVALA